MKNARIIAAVVCSFLISGVLGASGCSQRNMTNVVPYVPPAYYNGQLVMPFELANIYFSPYSPKTEIAKMNGNVYIFKNLKVTDITMDSIDKDYVWVDVVKAYALNPADLKQLRLGEIIDVAGILTGPCKEFPNSLTFSSCVFLPANTVTMPVGDGAALQYTPTY
jgi:hypothetical protein